MLIEKFKSNLGKSAHGGQTLYGHLMDCLKIACRILTDRRLIPDGYPKQKRDQLLFGTFIHDIGKLDSDFQAMLKAACNGQPLPSKRVKHEASTLDFEQLIRESEEEVKNHLQNVLNYKFTEPISFEDILAFAVTHHGLFYLSIEQRNEEMLPRIRREWTVFNYGEQRRITLADLLFDYHPLGGLIIIADLLGSYCYEQRLGDINNLFCRAGSLLELIRLLLQDEAIKTLEEGIGKYDPRLYGLRDLIILIAGGLI